MAPDPCWLPSAIMQTTGAIIGIYAVVYIYASRRIEHPIDLTKINFPLQLPSHKTKLTWFKTMHLSEEYKELVELVKKTLQDYEKAYDRFQDSRKKCEHLKQRCGTLDEKYRKTHKEFSVAFITLLFIGTGTILSNAIWLKFIIEKPDMIFPRLGEISFFLFTLTLVLILAYSILTVIFVTSVSTT